MAVAGIAAEREIHARCSSCLVMPIEWRDAAASEQDMAYEGVARRGNSRRIRPTRARGFIFEGLKNFNC